VTTQLYTISYAFQTLIPSYPYDTTSDWCQVLPTLHSLLICYSRTDLLHNTA